MDKIQTFQEFLATQGPELSLLPFIVNLVIAAVLSYVLYRVYIKFGESLSNRKDFGKNFILITMTTMTIITIVKSSLALSLGLVGALSVVRFRAAIKEPEELAYLYLTIAIGLGLGASQRGITTVAFAFIVAVIVIRKRFHKNNEEQNLYITLTDLTQNRIKLEQIVDVLKRNCSQVRMKRFDESEDMLEASFQINFNNFEQMEKSKEDLQALSKTVKIHYLDSGGV